MKNIYKMMAVLAIGLLYAACTNDDDSTIIEENTFGNAEFYFDNGVNGDKLILGSSYKNSNGETLTINRFNYIISNVVLIKADGTEYVYPKAKSYFIISEEADLHTISLKDIPAGDYTKVKFGLGVDNQRYLEGEAVQQEFWNYAAQHNLTWTWSTGYRFINFEGTFTPSQANKSQKLAEQFGFQIHQGSNSATDNYREIVLNLPTTARVRKGESPNIHIVTDANKIVDGTNKIILKDNLNPAGTNATIMGGENLIKIAENSLNMFTVDHVHNGSGTQHK
ncbi:hypothetical protein P3875_01630 [Myroides sp. JBRI-B21084]|uniref:MbnP family protein n=1 Tax=Myroides sp. JBRI-B21084 TaxID=3119977 RepID=UPI0026E237C5|nr:MbnP family protein [Paenimyroides cloacae]WKW46801.1 hypothetical protein P3875_01630 [Paenimyroides cloacae]